ncbi:MAG: hypothetical protein Q8941_08995 [Bacteroidota bacterium]|nr:hypothetical protein [Bacteroidota bacterium]
MKTIPIALLLVLMTACKTRPFVKHGLEFEKVADNCKAMNTGFKMNSNLNGERYEFQRCLDADFKKEQLTSIRQGDTIVLKFERKNTQQALYNLIVDLDAYPRYNFLTIDDNTFPIIPVGN